MRRLRANNEKLAASFTDAQAMMIYIQLTEEPKYFAERMRRLLTERYERLSADEVARVMAEMDRLFYDDIT